MNGIELTMKLGTQKIHLNYSSIGIGLKLGETEGAIKIYPVYNIYKLNRGYI